MPQKKPETARFDALKLRLAADLKWTDPNRAWGTIASELGVDPKTLYRWRQSEEWEVTFRQAGQEYVEALAPVAILALRKQWAKGNANGALDVLRSFGFLSNERIEIDQTMTAAEVIALQKRLAPPAD